MVNRFFVKFRQYIEKNSLGNVGVFQECNGILMFVMNRDVMDWNGRIQIAFPEQQYVNVCIEFCEIPVEIHSKEIFQAVNYLNTLALFERYYLNETGLMCEVNFLPETDDFDWKRLFNIIDVIFENAKTLTYDLVSRAIAYTEEKNIQKNEPDLSDSEPDEYDECDEDCDNYADNYREEDYRFSRRDLADYYGYQYDEDYSYEQFLDDI